jgi:sugar-specific transcriptional regulator TrmB
MNRELINWLTRAGLDEQRSSIYLAVLARYECKAAEIAADLGMSRTAMYDNLSFLEQRGFISKVRKGRVSFFKALQPHELEARFRSQLNQLNDLLPLFSSLASSKVAQPSIQRFKDEYAARHVFEDILAKRPEEYLYISNPVETYKMLTRRYITRWIQRRVELNIRAKGIRTVRLTDPADKIFTEEKKYLRSLRYLPEHFSFSATIYLYDNSVGLISSYRENEALIINSRDISSTFRNFFEILWGVSHR